MDIRNTKVETMGAVLADEKERTAFGWFAGLACSLAVLATVSVAQAQSPATRIAKRIDENRQEHPLIPALGFARGSLESVQTIKDYEAIFSKREMVAGTMQTQQMLLRLREEPFSVYVKCQQPNPGREVIYIAGKNDGKLLAHDTGIKALVGTLALDPTSTLAMTGNKYPITRIGMKNLIEAIITQWEGETNIPDVQVKYFPNSKLGNVDCKVIESTHPRPGDGVKFHRTRLYLTRSDNLPVRLEQFGFPSTAGTTPPLVEEYTYGELKTNIGLKEITFSTDNPEYAF